MEISISTYLFIDSGLDLAMPSLHQWIVHAELLTSCLSVRGHYTILNNIKFQSNFTLASVNHFDYI